MRSPNCYYAFMLCLHKYGLMRIGKDALRILKSRIESNDARILVPASKYESTLAIHRKCYRLIVNTDNCQRLLVITSHHWYSLVFGREITTNH